VDAEGGGSDDIVAVAERRGEKRVLEAVGGVEGTAAFQGTGSSCIGFFTSLAGFIGPTVSILIGKKEVAQGAPEPICILEA
jgi:hypothetical protein